MKKYLVLLLFAASFPLSAFNWPQEEIMPDSFYSYFGQLRGGTISTSLVFANTSDVKAADNGKVIAVINEYDDDSCFFPSSLGNAVIVAHNDSLLTVYGNIDGETLSKVVYTSASVKNGTVFGSSGNSGWQQGRSSL
ncbi:MAG: M23 family metallopeptidase, partial [Treponema sp.]